MSAAWTIILAIGAVCVLAALAATTLARRADVRGAGVLAGETRRRDRAAHAGRAPAGPTPAQAREAAEPVHGGDRPLPAVHTDAPSTQWVPPDPEALGLSRRMFLNRASVTLASAGIGAFSAASLVAFLWPPASGGFGQVVAVGKLADIKSGIASGGGFFYVPIARTWITEYPQESLRKAEAVYGDASLLAMRSGIVALYQKCPHLGCRVPQCVSSQWFECPCHGSQYNRVGEKKGGPAPRGMDRFPVTIDVAGEVSIDTGNVILGPPIGTNTTGQEAEGPHCVRVGGAATQ